MYDTDLPTRAELPTSRQLLRSTAIAAGVAAALLVVVVLPAEYGVDPTGIGRPLGLTQMGEIKMQLAREAEEDRVNSAPATAPRTSLPGAIVARLLIGTAAAQTPPTQTSPAQASPAPATRRDETTVTLAPGAGAEVKLRMRSGDRATYAWTTSGGGLNYDLHADRPGSRAHSYRSGRAAERDEGSFAAAFDGEHGWFWRNRGTAPVTVTLRTDGSYTAIIRP